MKIICDSNFILVFSGCFFLRARKTHCNGRLTKPIDNDDSRHFRLTGTHRHNPDSRKIGKKRVMSKVKALAKTTTLPGLTIAAQSYAVERCATKAVIPKDSQLVRMVNRVRRNSNFPQNPKSLTDLNLPLDFCKTLANENFLLYDNCAYEEGQERIIIFGTKGNLDFLSECHELYMDGTFKVSPVLFSQLYTIHGECHTGL